METREEKFKKYREEIKKSETVAQKVDETSLIDENIDYNSPIIKKNTLTMSIDKIIEAHDEYTTIIEKKEREEKLKQEKQAKTIELLKEIGKWVLIGIAIVVIIAVIIIVILTVIN